MLWDRFIRLFHWSLVTGIALNYWVLEGGDLPHEWLGYALGAWVLARIVRGFTGPPPVRFGHFVRGPRRVLYSIRHFAEDYREHRGHSPLGGWMVLLLLTLLATVVISGWMQELDAFWGEDWVESLHEFAADALIAAAVLHVAAVVTIQFYLKVPLIQSMLWKRRG